MITILQILAVSLSAVTVDNAIKKHNSVHLSTLKLQQHFDKQYGTGSPTKRAVDALTAVLQGFAAKDLGQAAVGLASPYLNEQIKLHTQNADGSVNTTVNLIAHALLGAVEAAATGNNLLAGAVATITAMRQYKGLKSAECKAMAMSCLAVKTFTAKGQI